MLKHSGAIDECAGFVAPGNLERVFFGAVGKRSLVDVASDQHRCADQNGAFIFFDDRPRIRSAFPTIGHLEFEASGDGFNTARHARGFPTAVFLALNA